MANILVLLLKIKSVAKVSERIKRMLHVRAAEVCTCRENGENIPTQMLLFFHHLHGMCRLISLFIPLTYICPLNLISETCVGHTNGSE